MPLLNKHDIQIIIADDSKVRRCDADCGVDWSSPEVTNLAEQQVEARFGNRVELEYLDLSKPSNVQRALELQQMVGDEDLLLPLLLINGKPRISGQFDFRMLLDAIDAEVEIY